MTLRQGSTIQQAIREYWQQVVEERGSATVPGEALAAGRRAAADSRTGTAGAAPERAWGPGALGKITARSS